MKVNVVAYILGGICIAAYIGCVIWKYIRFVKGDKDVKDKR